MSIYAALFSSLLVPAWRHIITPKAIIQRRIKELAGMLIAIARPEKPVCAITTPATAVGTPPTMASLTCPP